jgi:hypothetical protein
VCCTLFRCRSIILPLVLNDGSVYDLPVYPSSDHHRADDSFVDEWLQHNLLSLFVELGQLMGLGTIANLERKSASENVVLFESKIP